MLFCHSLLCGTAFDAVDAVKLVIPLGFMFSKFRLAEFPIIMVKFHIVKI